MFSFFPIVMAIRLKLAREMLSLFVYFLFVYFPFYILYYTVSSFESDFLLAWEKIELFYLMNRVNSFNQYIYISFNTVKIKTNYRTFLATFWKPVPKHERITVLVSLSSTILKTTPNASLISRKSRTVCSVSSPKRTLHTSSGPSIISCNIRA